MLFWLANLRCLICGGLFSILFKYEHRMSVQLPGIDYCCVYFELMTKPGRAILANCKLSEDSFKHNTVDTRTEMDFPVPQLTPPNGYTCACLLAVNL
jgi:hypothetical protein